MINKKFQMNEAGKKHFAERKGSSLYELIFRHLALPFTVMETCNVNDRDHVKAVRTNSGKVMKAHDGDFREYWCLILASDLSMYFDEIEIVDHWVIDPLLKKMSGPFTKEEAFEVARKSEDQPLLITKLVAKTQSVIEIKEL